MATLSADSDDEDSESASAFALPIGSLFDDDDEEEERPPTPPTGDRALDEFRQAWRVELGRRRPATPGDVTPKADVESETFERASAAFVSGMAHEEAGRLSEAVRCYAAAVHAVPDIERLVFKGRPKGAASASPQRQPSSPVVPAASSRCESLAELLAALQPKLYAPDGAFVLCHKESPDVAGLHLSALPVEVVLYLFRWVVGAELDFRSLELLAGVSPGLFLLSRQAEAWRLGCRALWAGLPPQPPSPYPSWRALFIDRPHPLSGGVYIARTSYVRHGEEGFQDLCYRPWHVVVYFRYVRLLAGGRAVMLTTADEPGVVLGHLQGPEAAERYPGLLVGRWRPMGHDEVEAQLRWDAPPEPAKRAKKALPYDCVARKFHLELRVEPVRRRRSARLVWLAYSTESRRRDGSSAHSELDLCEQNFPPLYYSRVKSFGATASTILA